MKTLILTLGLLLGVNSFAHEGHGDPLPASASKYGGTPGLVVDGDKMEKKVEPNPGLYKAELMRSQDGTVRLYLFDSDMKKLKAEDFSAQAQGVVDNTKAGKKENFSLKAQKGIFIGKMPKQKKHPYNIYVSFTKGTQKLFAAFDGLD